MAPSGFTRKKVSTLTLGERLREIRSNFRISLSDVSKNTKIQVKYLEYLENGEYEKLPADVYVRGFVRSYVRYLNLDEQTFLKLYEREQHIQKNLRPEEKKTALDGPLSRFSLVITPRSVVLVAIVLILFGAFFYLYREFRSFAALPRLVIFEPAKNAVLEKSEVTVRGQTERGARVSINNQPAFVGNEGEFTENLLLQPGLNTITISAVSRLEKERVEVLTLEARYTPAASNEEATQTETFFVNIEAGKNDINIIIEADQNLVFSGILRSGEKKSVGARERIRLTTNNPAETLVRFNEEETLPLGQVGEGLKEVIFTKDGLQTSKPLEAEVNNQAGNE